jgi:aromatic-L-amino-acid decarboxylase
MNDHGSEGGELLLDSQEIFEAARRLGEFLSDYQGGLDEQRVFPKLDRHVIREILDEPWPEQGRPLADLFAEAEQRLVPNSTHIAHPRFLAYVIGSPNGLAPFAEAVTTALNQNCGIWSLSPAANAIEQKVVAWFAEIFGFPVGATGLITSGGSMANLTALTVARDSRLGDEGRRMGLQGRTSRLIAYTSDSVHASIDKAISILGLGLDSLHRIPSDEHFQLSPDRLLDQIRLDRKAGLTPFCVIASAGTVTTGAIDPIDALADLCEEEDLWLHVDGAYGAFGILSDRIRPLLRGIGRADSLSLDPHKLLFSGLEAGCVLFRDPERPLHSFRFKSSYIADHGDPDLIDYGELGTQLSRGSKAFKVWWALRAFGREAYTRSIDRLLDLARYMGDRIEEEPDLELLAPVEFTAVCFRHCRLDDGGNQRLQQDIVDSGLAFLGPARVGGVTGIRACFTNLRTRERDIDEIVPGIVELARNRVTREE